MLMLLSACTSHLLVGDEADGDDDSWEASTADSCCVMMESNSMMNDTSFDRE